MEFKVESFKIIASVTSPMTEQYVLRKEGSISLSDAVELKFLHLTTGEDSETFLNRCAVSLFHRVRYELSPLKAQVE